MADVAVDAADIGSAIVVKLELHVGVLALRALDEAGGDALRGAVEERAVLAAREVVPDEDIPFSSHILCKLVT